MLSVFKEFFIDRANVPILIMIATITLYLVKTENTGLLLIALPPMYIFRYQIRDIFETAKSQDSEERVHIVQENSQKRRSTIQLDETFARLLRKLRNYRRYSPHNYTIGKRYLRMFVNNLYDVTRDDIYHSKHLIENAREYLRISLNHFHAIQHSVPETNMIAALRYNKSISRNVEKHLGTLCKGIELHGHLLLYNYTQKLDREFRENPNIYSGEIAVSHQNVLGSNTYHPNELY